MNRAKEILKSFYGYSEFRKGQEEIINEIISGLIANENISRVKEINYSC